MRQLRSESACSSGFVLLATPCDPRSPSSLRGRSFAHGAAALLPSMQTIVEDPLGIVALRCPNVCKLGLTYDMPFAAFSALSSFILHMSQEFGLGDRSPDLSSSASAISTYI